MTEIRVDIDKKPAKTSPTVLDEALRSQDVIDKTTPIVPVHVEQHPARIITRPDGTRHHDWVLTFKRSHVEAIRQGYACLRCWSWQSEPFPIRCRNTFCAYEMRMMQAEEFAREFDGDQWVGPRTDLAEEQERLSDWARGDRLEKGERSMGILVPDWADV